MKLWQTIRNFFSPSSSQETLSEDYPEEVLAAAMLLIEASYADFHIAEVEVAKAAQYLAAICTLSEDEARAVMEHVCATHPDEVSMHPWLVILNEKFSRAQKEQLLQALWSIVYADGIVDVHEEHRVRHIAKLLYLPHSAYIRAKHQASL